MGAFDDLPDVGGDDPFGDLPDRPAVNQDVLDPRDVQAQRTGGMPSSAIQRANRPLEDTGGGWQQFKSEVGEGFRAGMQAARSLGLAINQRSAANYQKEAEQLEAAGAMTAAAQKRATAEMVRQESGGLAASLAKSEGESTFKPRPVMAELQHAKTYGEAWETIKQDPLGFAAAVTAGSAPQLAPIIVAGALGGPVAAAGVAGGMAGGQELGGGILQYAGEHGVDPKDAKALQAFYSDPEQLKAALEYAGKRAAVQAPAQALMAAIPGVNLAPRAMGAGLRVGTNLAAQSAVQAVGQPLAEAGAQVAQKGAVTEPGQVVAQAVGGAVAGPLEALGYRGKLREAKAVDAKAARAKIWDGLPDTEIEGSPAKVMPNGAVVTAEQWNAAPPKRVEQWMKERPAQEGVRTTPPPDERKVVNGVRVDEEIEAAPPPQEGPDAIAVPEEVEHIVAPAPPKSERVLELERLAGEAESPEVSARLKQQADAEAKKDAKAQRAEMQAAELEKLAMKTQDRDLREELAKQARKLRGEPEPKPEPKPSTKGMKVEEGTVEEIVAKPVKEEPNAEAQLAGETAEPIAPAKQAAAEPTAAEREIGRSESPILKALQKAGGIHEDQLPDMGLAKVIGPKKTVTKVGKDGKLRKVTTQPRDDMRVGKQSLFRKDGSLRIDDVVEWMEQHGYMTAAEIEQLDRMKPGGSQERARQLLKQELDRPGSVRKVGEEGDLYEAQRKAHQEAYDAELEAHARELGIETAGKKPEEIHAAVIKALDADWTQRVETAGYKREDMDLVARASHADPEAFERASVAHENDDAAFMRAVKEIVDAEQNGRTREGNAPAPSARVAGEKPAGQPAQRAEAPARGENAVRNEQGARAAEGKPSAGSGPEAEQARPERGAETGGLNAKITEGGRPNEIPSAQMDEKQLRVLDEAEQSMQREFGRGNFQPADGADPGLGKERVVQNRIAAAIKRALGGEIAFFSQPEGRLLDGFVSPKDPRTSFVAVDSKHPALAVAGHEFGHWLEQNHPELWDQFVRNVYPALKNVTKHQQDLAALYRKAGGKPLSEQRAFKELISDIWGDFFTDREFHSEVAKLDPAFYQRFAEAVMRFLDDVMAKIKQVRPFGTEEFISDMQRARRIAAEIYLEVGKRAKEQRELERRIARGPDDQINLSLSHADEVSRGPDAILPDETASQKWERLLFDKFNRTLQAEEIAGATDAQSIRLAEKLLHGRAQHEGEKLEREFIKPLGEKLKAAKKLGLTVEDADDYLMAKHAPERNATLAQRDPNGRQGLSGLTNEQAKDIVESYTPEQRKALEAIGKIVRDINNDRLDRLVESGLITQATREALDAQWKNYVPMKTLEAEDKATGTGRGYELWKTDIKAAFGRTSKASSPIAATIMDATRAIVRAEKARVEKVIWNFAGKEGQDIIRPYDPATPPKEVMKRTFDKDGKVKEVADPLKVQDMTLHMLIDGEERRVFIPDETLRTQLRKAGEFENLHAILEGVGKATRVLGRTLTEWNPSFTFPNAVKDAISAYVRGHGIDNFNTGRMLRSIPLAWGAIVNEKLGRDTPGAKAYAEFKELGGKTGAYGIIGVKESLAKLDKLGAELGYAEHKPGVVVKTGRQLHKILDALSAANEVLEYATRLAAFQEARRGGYTPERAAEIGKEITVNFNRSGEVTRGLNALYVFTNAALQGLYATGSFATGGKLIKPDSVTGKHVRHAMIVVAAAGFIFQGLNELLGGEDEETGEKNIDTISDYSLDKNLTLLMPGSSRGVKIPLPPEYSFLYAMGRRLYRAGSERQVGREAAGIAGALVDSALPIRLSESTSAPMTAMKAVTPTVALPPLELLLNENFLGQTIVPVQRDTQAPQPYTVLARRNTSDVAKAIADLANTATGGDRIEPGGFQKVMGPMASAEGIQFLAGQYTGGLGQFALQASNLGKAAAGDEKAADINRMPVVSRFAFKQPEGYVARRYRELVPAFRYAAAREKQGEDTERSDPAAVASLSDYTSAERELRPLFKQLREAGERGDREAAEALDTEIKTVQRRVIKAYNEARRAQ